MSKKYYLTVLTIFKNENQNLREWIEHYRFHGADHLYMIDDGSTDGFRETLSPYLEEGYVTLYSHRVMYEAVGRQMWIYQQFLPEIRADSEWIAVLDLDEFLYSPKCLDIKETLRQYEQCSMVFLDWSMFGSSGHILQPQSVVAGFQRRAHHNREDYSGKSIVRADHLKQIRIHWSETDGLVGRPCWFGKGDQEADFVLNHYYVQSEQFWREIKMTRGDADRYLKERTMERFHDFDFNDVIDDRLFQQNRSLLERLGLGSSQFEENSN